MNTASRTIGDTGVTLAPLVLGGNVFGWTADRATSFALLDRALDAGLTTLDTADVYSRWVPGHQGGESETVIGQWLAARGSAARDRVQVMTKVGMDMGAAGQGLSSVHIQRAVEASLERLRTDRIDVYFSHVFDEAVPQAETLAAYDRLIRAGKVRAIGASNFAAGQLRAALDVATAQDLPRYQVLQPHYNLIDRAGFDGPLRDLAQAEGLAVVTYFSLASGFLTGKYRSESDLAGSTRGDWARGYLNPRGFTILAALDAVAARHGAQPGEVALAWLMARPGVSAPIASATRLEQLEGLIRATRLHLSDEDIRTLEQASAPTPTEHRIAMISSTTITTAEPARIILRLCKHWGHRYTVDYDETRGRIELPLGLCLLTAGEGTLDFRLEGTPDADMDKFEQVVADHAQRMARGETYTWQWTRQAG